MTGPAVHTTKRKPREMVLASAAAEMPSLPSDFVLVMERDQIKKGVKPYFSKMPKHSPRTNSISKWAGNAHMLTTTVTEQQVAAESGIVQGKRFNIDLKGLSRSMMADNLAAANGGGQS